MLSFLLPSFNDRILTVTSLFWFYLFAFVRMCMYVRAVYVRVFEASVCAGSYDSDYVLSR